MSRPRWYEFALSFVACACVGCGGVFAVLYVAALAVKHPDIAEAVWCWFCGIVCACGFGVIIGIPAWRMACELRDKRVAKGAYHR